MVVITLTSDFGTRDAYAAELKAAVLALAREVQLVVDRGGKRTALRIDGGPAAHAFTTTNTLWLLLLAVFFMMAGQ